MTLRNAVMWALPALLVCSTACRRGETTAQKETTEGTKRGFRAFADEYFSAYFSFYPSSGTAAGFHEYDSKLEDFSSGRVRNRIAELRRLQGQLDKIRSEKLDADDAIDATLLDNQIKAELLDHEYVRTWRKNPLGYAIVPGNAIDQLMKRNFAPAHDRLRSIVARLRRITPLFDAMRNNVTEPPKEFTDLAVRALRGSVGFFRDTVPVWAREAAGDDIPLISEFETENRKVVAELEVVAQFLDKELSPLSTGKFAIGSDAFAHKLEYEEMVDIPLDKLLQIGEAALDRDYKAFVETARKVAPGKSPSEAMRALSNDHPTEDNLIEFASSTTETIRKFVIDRKIIPIPSEERAKTTPTPPYLRSIGFASMDTPGAFENNAREAFFYVTPPEPDWNRSHKEEHLRLFGRPVMDVITIHEAYPGHYVQFLYAKQFPTRVRKLTSCGTNVEGWAHYAEQMMLEEGFGGGDSKIRLAQLSEALVRDARYVAGIKLHTQQMTVEQATRIFIEKAFLEPANAFEEARRGSYNPTYLYYTLGKLQIYKLREDYKRAKAGDYSLGKFHGDFIRQGPIPLKLMRQILLPGDNSPTL